MNQSRDGLARDNWCGISAKSVILWTYLSDDGLGQGEIALGTMLISANSLLDLASFLTPSRSSAAKG